MSTSKQASEITPSSLTQTKTFYERVEEFKLWNDDQTFKSHEYERRRIEKIQKKGVLKVDKPLSRARSLYLPSVLCFVFGTAVLLYSAVNNAARENDLPIVKNPVGMKIVGGVFGGLGLLALMATAAYTYHREDKVRRCNGYPTLFESSRVRGGGSVFGIRHQESMAVVNEFKDRPRDPGSVGQVRAGEENAEATQPFLFLVSANADDSFSSSKSNATLQWLDKHGSYFYNPGSELKRQRSDSALDQSFARSSLYTPEQSFRASAETAERKTGLGGDNEQYRVVKDGHTAPISSPDKESVHNTNRNAPKSLGRLSTKHNNPLIKVEEYKEVSHWVKETVSHSNPGVSISSTDSSGYASSDYFCVIDKARPKGHSRHQLHKQKSNHPCENHRLHTDLTMDVSGPKGEIQTRVNSFECQARQNVSNLKTHNRVCAGLAKVDLKSLEDTEDDLTSTAAVHNVWTPEENDGESLTPPVSPDISSLPYLATNIFSKKPVTSSCRV